MTGNGHYALDVMHVHASASGEMALREIASSLAEIKEKHHARNAFC
jgi:hypothetical protein